jgi:hypothetical protein
MARDPVESFEFFRVDRVRSTWRNLVFGASMVAVGASAIGSAFAHRLDPSATRTLRGAGGLLLLVGLFVGFGTMIATLLNNAYLGMSDDGIVLHDGGVETLLAWESVARIEHRRDAIVIAEASGREQLFYAGSTAKVVAERIELVRRRAALGLVGHRLRA